MTISETREKCKSLIGKVPRDVLIIAILLLASSLSFGLGYLAGLEVGQTSPISLETSSDASSFSTTTALGQFVASKTGTKYYLPTCAGASRISTANKVWFLSAADAVRAGYSPAANCTGL